MLLKHPLKRCSVHYDDNDEDGLVGAALWLFMYNAKEAIGQINYVWDSVLWVNRRTTYNNKQKGLFPLQSEAKQGCIL